MWVDIMLVLLTGVSALIAGTALRYAKQATQAAASAVLVAKDANRIAKDANAIAKESNAIAEDAAQHERDVPKAVAWNDYIVALSALQAFDPTSEPAAAPLNELRTRATLLVDLLEWDGFGEWLALEHRALIQRMHEAMLKGQMLQSQIGRKTTPDEMVEILKSFHVYVAGLTSNVRLCRRSGPEAVPFKKLSNLARADIAHVAARNTWTVPAETIEGLSPLEP